MNFFSSRKGVFAIVFLLLRSSMVFSQQRMIDHEAICISPAGEVINGSTLPLDFGMINHGPDTRYVADTIVYRLFSIFSDGQGRAEYQGPLMGVGNEIIPVGGKLMYGDRDRYVIKFDYPDIKEPLVLDFCVEISTFFLNERGDTIQYVSHYDPVEENNRCCKVVTVMPKAASAAIALRQQEEGVWTYPNPVQDILHIRTAAGFAENEVQMSIYDIRGSLRKEQQYEVDKSVGDTWLVDIRDLSPGIYYLRLQSKKGMVTQKFIVDR